MASENYQQKPNYPQPHNLKFNYIFNPAFEYNLRLKVHGRLKYEAKYRKSKQSKRNKD